LECFRLDSLNQEEEDDEAHLPVPLARRGRTCSGGAMVRWSRWCEAFSPSFAHREEKRERVEEGRWRRRGWERARV
jgi:hypothetical protein